MTWRQRLREWWRKVKDWFGARRLLVNEDKQAAAQEAVNRVVYETDIPPDCVTAGVWDGGACIKVKHADAWEMFVHRTYDEAASEAIAWLRLQGEEVSYRHVTKLDRRTRRAFNAHHKRHQPQKSQVRSKTRGRR